MPPPRRRANDPELLRAQAQGGRDGAAAYEQNQTLLAGQRQSAMRQAMQAAALRGAPAAAIAQLAGGISRPYDQAIAQQSNSQQQFGQQMQARRGEMADYTAAVNDARSLIPGQIQQTLAPIRAQNRLALQSIRLEGANRVSELEGQTRLQEAQMAAAAQAARIARRQQAAANQPTMTQSEMAAALETGGAGILSNAQAQAQAMVERNQQRFAGAYETDQAAQAQADESGGVVGNMLAGLGLGATAEAGPGQLPAGMDVATASTFAPEAVQGTPETGDVIGKMLGSLGLGATAETGPVIPDQYAPVIDMLKGIGQFAEQGGERPYYSPQTGFLTANQMGRLAGRYGDLTGPLIRTAYQSPITGARSIAEIMGGQPVTTGYSPEGVPIEEVMPQATETYREAMQNEAAKLAKQGYAFGGPELALGMQANQGQTLANFMAEQGGQPSIADQITAARKEAEDAIVEQQRLGRQGVSDAYRANSEYRAQTGFEQGQQDRTDRANAATQTADAKTQAEKTKQDRINQISAVTGGLVWTPSLGPVDQVWDKVTNQQTGPAVVQALKSVGRWLQDNATDQGWDVDLALEEAAKVNPMLLDPTVRRLAKALYG